MLISLLRNEDATSFNKWISQAGGGWETMPPGLADADAFNLDQERRPHGARRRAQEPPVRSDCRILHTSARFACVHHVPASARELPKAQSRPKAHFRKPHLALHLAPQSGCSQCVFPRPLRLQIATDPSLHVHASEQSQPDS